MEACSGRGKRGEQGYARLRRTIDRLQVHFASFHGFSDCQEAENRSLDALPPRPVKSSDQETKHLFFTVSLSRLQVRSPVQEDDDALSDGMFEVSPVLV